MADPDRFLLQPDVAADWEAPVQYVRKDGDTWGPRPTNDPAVLVLWVGADPSPPGATAPARTGMYPGDLRVTAFAP